MKKIAVIADDLSGANDAGSQVYHQGYTTCSLNNEEYKPECHIDIPVYNSSTRAAKPEKAYSKVKRIAGILSNYNLIYKKTDSTLRGNIGAEIDGCIDALKIKKAAFVSSFPELKRRTAYGRLFLSGKVIENTEFANDAFNPVTSSNIMDLLKSQSRYLPVLLDIDLVRKGSKEILKYIKVRSARHNNKPVIYVFDCLTDKDLETISKCLGSFKVVAGASALLKHLVKKKKRKSIKCNMKIGTGQVYFIGSMKRTTHEQLDLLRKYLEHKKNNTAVIAVERSKPFSKQEGNRINDEFASLAMKFAGNRCFGKLVISGGATAENIFKTLKINYTEITGAMLTGVPLTYSPERNLYIVTKPGGYGDKKAFVKIYEKLKEQR